MISLPRLCHPGTRPGFPDPSRPNIVARCSYSEAVIQTRPTAERPLLGIQPLGLTSKQILPSLSLKIQIKDCWPTFQAPGVWFFQSRPRHPNTHNQLGMFWIIPCHVHPQARIGQVEKGSKTTDSSHLKLCFIDVQHLFCGPVVVDKSTGTTLESLRPGSFSLVANELVTFAAKLRQN